MNILVLTGAGISAESGLKTFRDCEDGMWNNYKIEEVCSVEAMENNFEKVLEFYSKRREEALNVKPNAGHYALVELEKYHNVDIVTQNVDFLHELAGSSNVIHLHGELNKARDMVTEEVFDDSGDFYIGKLSPNGNQLRPHIVVFGEMVPNMRIVDDMLKNNHYDYLIIIGTSMAVYPAAGIIHFIDKDTKVIIVDPNKPSHCGIYEWFEGSATEQLPKVVEMLKNL
jgi:NAD-dependent deacetylase